LILMKKKLKRKPDFQTCTGRLNKYIVRQGWDFNTASASMIGLSVWYALRALGQQDALTWISTQVNESMESAIKVRKKRNLSY
jgi:hypothetical protein